MALTERIQLPSTSAEIAQQLLDDLDLELRDVGVENPPIQPGTDYYILVNAHSKIALLCVAKIQQAESSTSVFDATGDDLDDLMASHGVEQLAAKKSSGYILPTISGTVTFEEGLPLTRNGIRYIVNGTQYGLTQGSELGIIAVKGGSAADAASGETIEFDNPPLGVEKEATVSLTVPITGGTDEETDDDKRTRLLDKLRYPPAGGNPGHIRDIVSKCGVNSDGTYNFCALGGPGSSKTSVLKAFDPDNADFSRALNSVALSIVRAAVQSQLPPGTENVVGTTTDEAVDIALSVTIPDSALAGGDGTGWVDSAPWPPLAGGDTKVTVSVVTSTKEITVHASTTTSPVAGITHVAWHAPGDQKIRQALVTAVSGSSGAWALTLDRPLVDSDNNSVAVGDYVSPAAVSMSNYGSSWLAIMGKLGPGENSTNANIGARDDRLPDTTDGPQHSLTNHLLLELQKKHPEISAISYSYRSKSAPTTPSTVSANPNVLTPNRFGIYQA